MRRYDRSTSHLPPERVPPSALCVVVASRVPVQCISLCVVAVRDTDIIVFAIRPMRVSRPAILTWAFDSMYFVCGSSPFITVDVMLFFSELLAPLSSFHFLYFAVRA